MRVEVTHDLAEPHALRRAVFIEEQGFTEADEWDDLDAGAVQLVIRDAGRAVASARLLDEGTAGRIGRICVLKDWRGRGLGADLVRFGIDHFRAAGKVRVVLGAQVQAQAFYAGLGFEPVGDVYDDGGVPHQEMVCPL